MSTELLPCAEAGVRKDAKWSVLWMHGLGADGHDFEPIVPYLGLDPAWKVRFVFPHAPSMPVSINNGFVMPAWYDIRDLDLGNRHDEAGIEASAERITALMAREFEAGVPYERQILAGFSQGGAMALYVGLRFPHKLAGIMALSTYLVMEDSLAEERSDANLTTPVFQAHGQHDPMVPLPRGEAARRRLEELGYPVTWHKYPMQHQVCDAELHDIAEWFGGIFRES